MVDAILQGMALAFSFEALVAIFVGLVLGQMLGAIPGLTATMGVALLVPYTFFFDPWVGIPMLLGMFKGTYFGASITGILLRTPGTPAAAMTAIDGYPLAQQGKGGKALKTALYASVFGDTFSDVVLIVAAGLLAMIAIRFGPPEFALLILFSLLTLGSLGGREPWKAVVAIGLGIILGSVGIDRISGLPRLTFGSNELADGFPLIPTLIGFLAISEILLQMEKPAAQMAAKALHFSPRKEDNRVSWPEFRSLLPTLFRASALGTFIGALPGLGATIASFLAYNDARRVAKHPEEFGKGSLHGIAAPEAANSAVSGANYIPLLAFGIPGDVTAALILGALLIQGITPGPLVFRDNPVEIYAILTCMLFATFMNLFVGQLFIRVARTFALVPKSLLFPAVIVIAAAGGYATRTSLADVVLVFAFGFLGYIMIKLRFPLVPLLIALILTPILETSIRRTLLIIHSERGSLLFLLERPIFLILLTILVTILFLLFQSKRKLARARAAKLSTPDT